MKCRLCFQSEQLQEINYKNEIYFFCPECEYIFLAEKFIPGPEEEQARYAEHDNTLGNEGYVNMFEKFIDQIIIPHQKGVETVLDFGCGPGPVLAHLLRERGFVVDVYDPYFYPEKIFADKKYDLITSTEVFEHLKNPSRIVELLLEHLNPGGLLALMTSFHPGPENFADWWYKWDPTHIGFYNETTFRWIAKDFSLELIMLAAEKYCLFRKQD